MAETFFHDGQHLFAGLGEDNAPGVQPGTGKTGSKQIGLPQNPQDRTIQTRQDTSDEQGGGGGVFRVGAGRGGLMQGTEAQTAGGQSPIDCNNLQRNRPFGGTTRMDAFDPGDPLSQVRDGRRGRRAFPRGRPSSQKMAEKMAFREW